MALTTVYRRNPDIIMRPILDEVLLVPIRGELAELLWIFSLNAVARHIWECLDGERNLGVLRDGLVDRFEVEPKQAETDLREFIRQLLSAKLIEEVA